MSPFRSKYKITQGFGERPEYYSQFGLKGHEGIDLIPTGTVWDVLCLADGVVVRDEDNPRSGNYGVYVTVWHPQIKKATQYCHLQENYVNNGDRVSKGQKIGLMGATGNVTGAHLHLNLFEVDDNGYRLNKDNGYLGGIDPLPFLESDDTTEEQTVAVPSKTFTELVRKSTGWDSVLQKLDIADNQDIVLAEIDKFLKYEDALYEKQKQIDSDKDTIDKLQVQLQDLQDNLTQLKEENQNLQNQAEDLKKQNQELEDQVAKQAATIQLNISQINELTSNLNLLKEQLQQKPLSGLKAFLWRIIQKI